LTVTIPRLLPLFARKVAHLQI